jgi:hypothetical protein
LFHFDVPWNPGRLEQRNGRIDRKLQPSPTVHCHYFVYPQRKLDRVLQVLVEKTKRINNELGSAGKVLESSLEALVHKAMGEDEAALQSTIDAIERLEVTPEERLAVEEELESVARKREGDLRKQIQVCERLLERSKEQLGLDNDALRASVNCALELHRAAPLRAVRTAEGQTAWELPSLETQPGKGDWADTMDTLRQPPDDGERNSRWRSQAPIRPLVFDAPQHLDDSRVHVHLEHRVVKRLLSRFLAQGFVHHDLSRTCLGASRDEHTRVVLLGRVALYGRGAARLHEEILCVSARWSDPAQRNRLVVEGVDATKETFQWLQQTLTHSLAAAENSPVPTDLRQRLHAALPKDLDELRPLLEQRGLQAKDDAARLLQVRGAAEARLMKDTLNLTGDRIRKKMTETEEQQLSFAPEERDEQRTLESNRRYWKQWLANVEADLDQEPRRVSDFYAVASHRIEPLGIVYLVGARATGAR